MDATFADASDNGRFTPVPITVSGVSVPANSVYWNLGSTAAGTTGRVSFAFNVPNGVKDGATYTVRSTIDSAAFAANIPAGVSAQSVAVQSQGRPSLRKQTLGVFNQLYVVNSALLQPVVTYILTLTNTYNPTRTEVLWRPSLSDDLSDVLALLAKCGADSSAVSGISDAGQLQGTRIAWTALPTFLAPGASYSVSFQVNFTLCVSNPSFRGTRVTNRARSTSLAADAVTASADVVIGVDLRPVLYAALGKGWHGLSGVQAGKEDLPTAVLQPGDSLEFLARLENRGASALGQVVIVLQNPGLDLLSAYGDAAATPSFYYSSQADPSQPPALVTTGSGLGGSWLAVSASNPPPSNVTWVALFLPCLGSYNFPTGNSSDVCANAGVTTLGVRAVVRASTPCAQVDYTVSAWFYALQASTSTVNTAALLTALPTPVTLTDAEVSHQRPPLPTFYATVSGLNTLSPGQTATYTLRFTNTGSGVASGVSVQVPYPTVDVNGQVQALWPIISSGTSLRVNDSTAPAYATLYFAEIPPGAYVELQETLTLPAKGTQDKVSVLVSATLTAQSPSACSTAVGTASQSAVIQGNSLLLQASLFTTEGFARPGDSVTYRASLLNLGTSPTRDT